MKDLFGDDIKEKPPSRGYSGGYPARPGSGPQGYKCKDCCHKTNTVYNGKLYPKCGLMKGAWTHGSDIKAGSPACAKFVRIIK